LRKILCILDRYDYIFLLIVLGFMFFGLQQITFKQSLTKSEDNLSVVVNVPLADNVLQNITPTEIDSLYFDQAREVSSVTRVEKVQGGLNIYFEGPGESNGRYVFAGRTVNLNDRIKLTGGLSADGYIVSIERIDAR